MPSRSRRRFLRTAGLAAASALGGCGFAGGSGSPATVTPVPVPTDTPVPTPEPTPPPPTPEDFAFDVTILSGFDVATPARLGITFENTGDRLLTGLGGRQFVLPFVDDDYGGLDESGRFGLFLAPDDTALSVAPEGQSAGPVGRFLPDEPTDGCWRLPFDWPAAEGVQPGILYTVTVQPGEAVRHEYGLYHVDDCEAGRFTFEGTFDLTNTNPPLEQGLRRTRLGFDLVVSPAETLRLDVHDPVVAGPPATR